MADDASQLATRVALAYEARDRDLVSLHETVRMVIVVLTPFIMFLLSLAGGRIELSTSIYILFAYVIVLYLLLAVLSSFTPGVYQCFSEQLGTPHRHSHALGYTSVLHATVIVWLFWLVTTHLIDAADLVHGSRSLVLVVLLAAASWATVVCTYTVSLRRFLPPATHAFVFVFLLCLVFPSADWMPQSHSWSSIVRVGIFFAITLVLDISTTTDEVCEAVVNTAVDPVADHRSSRVFCVTVAQTALLGYADALRTRRILAQSAWVLVTSSWDMLLIGAALLLTAFIMQPPTLYLPPQLARAAESVVKSTGDAPAERHDVARSQRTDLPRPTDAFSAQHVVVDYRWN